MIDLHSHIIFGVDDGSSSIEQSIKMIEEAEKQGIRIIIATPHYHEAIFEHKRLEENYQELMFKAQQYDVAIKIGYEVFVDPFNPSAMKGKKRLCLNRSGRILIEFPFNVKPANCLEAIRRLQLGNYIPVIAHPERNRSFLNCFGDLVTLIKAGCMIQIDAASIAGVYGIRVKEFAKKLIQMNFADVVASNVHHPGDYTKWYMKAYNNVANWAGQESAIRLFYLNARVMLEGTDDNQYINVIV